MSALSKVQGRIPDALVHAVRLLLVAACTIREDSFGPRDNTRGGLSFNAPDLNAPVVGDSGACPGGFARSSQMQDYRDGTQELFCD
jgi:hypothetical protein